MADDTLDDAYLQRQRVESSPTLRLLQEREAGITEAEPEEPAAPTITLEPVTPSRGVLGDIGAGLGELPKQVLGGVRDAAVEAGQAVESLADYLFAQKLGLPKGPRLKVKIPEVADPESVTGGIARSAAQFLTGFVPFFKATKAVGITAPVVRGAAAGAAADVTVFDPQTPRLSNLLNDLAPALKTPITEYLAASPDDSEAEGRFKNAVEGLGLGALTEGVVRAVRAMRTSATAAKLHKAGERATGTRLKAKPFEALTPEERGLAELGAEYEGAVAAQRRGTRTHAEAAADAEGLGMTLDDVRTLMPGTAMNDQEAVAVVKVLAESGERLKALATTAKTGDPAAVRDFLSALYTHAQVDPKRLGVLAEAGRTLSVLNEPISGLNQFLAQFQRLFQDARRGITPQRLAEMVDAFQTPQQLAVFARQLAKPGWTDAVMEAWINGLLSNPATHAVNALSNSLMALWAVPERALAAQFGAGVAKGEATALLYGMAGGFEDALRLAGRAFREGAPTSGLSKIELRPKAITRELVDASGAWGRAVDVLGEVVRLPGRLLISSDEFFRVVAYRGELRAQAFREGVRAANSEGLTGAARARRAAEVMVEVLNDPPLSVREAAERFGSVQTFTEQLGKFGSALLQARDAHPAARVAVPFLQTPANLARQAVQRTPLGLLSRSVWEDITAGGARADLAKAKLALGSAVMATAGLLSAQGLITGGGPKDENLRRELRNTGWQPYSLKLGDTYVAYNRLDPVGMILGLAADAADVLGQVDEIDGEDLAVALSVAVAKNITSKTWLKGLSETVNAVSDPDRYSAKMIRNLAGTAIPFTSLVAQVERTVDPTLREARTVLDHVRSRIPGLSETLPPRRNLFGEPIVLGGGLGPDLVSPLYVSRAREEPVSEELVRNDLSIAMPPKTIARIELTPEEYDRFVVLAGSELTIGGLGLKARLERVIASPAYRAATDGPDGGQALMFRRWVHAYRALAERQVLREFPDLGASVEAARRASRQKIQRPAPAPPEPDVDAMIESLTR